MLERRPPALRNTSLSHAHTASHRPLARTHDTNTKRIRNRFPDWRSPASINPPQSPIYKPQTKNRNHKHHASKHTYTAQPPSISKTPPIYAPHNACEIIKKTNMFTYILFYLYFTEGPPLRGGNHICKQNASNVPSPHAKWPRVPRKTALQKIPNSIKKNIL